jgi:adenine phosphoribosyltransferase
MHVDGVFQGQNVLVVDDLLATGGTVEACCRLVENCGANVVACAFLIELVDLKGRAKIAPREAMALLQY